MDIEEAKVKKTNKRRFLFDQIECPNKCHCHCQSHECFYCLHVYSFHPPIIDLRFKFCFSYNFHSFQKFLEQLKNLTPFSSPLFSARKKKERKKRVTTITNTKSQSWLFSSLILPFSSLFLFLLLTQLHIPYPL